MKRFMMTAAVTALTGTVALAAVDVSDLDINGDSFVSMDELLVAYPNFDASFFDEIDTNDDGRIDSQELYEIEAQNILARTTAPQTNLMADMNNDGFVTFEELTTEIPGFSQYDFETLDSNDDGRLDFTEVQAPGASAIINGEQAAVTTIDLDSIDTDGDRFLSYGELLIGFPDVPQIGFDEIDLNDDGRLDFTELNSPGARTMLNKY